jgi:hypothetical protein
MTMTRDQWIQRIHEGKVNIFGSIPKKHQDTEMVFHWVASGFGSLKEVPLNLVTDEIRMEAVRAFRNDGSDGLTAYSMVTIKPSHTERYEETALLAIKTRALNIWVVDNAFLNNDFMKKALKINGDALLPLLDEDANLDGMDIELSQDLIDVAVSCSASYFGKFKKNQYSRQAVVECIKHCDFDYQHLVDIDQVDALVEVIKTGWWGDHLPEKPSNLSDCAVKLLVSKENQEKLVYRAFAMNYPIRDVIAFFAGPTLQDEILQMYSRKDLTPFFKSGPLSENKALKGRLLESELGL